MRLQPREGWLTYVLLLLVMLSVVWAVDRAQWLITMPPLALIVVEASLIGLLLAKIRLPAILLHPIAALLAAGLLTWHLAPLSPAESFGPQVREVYLRVGLWLKVAKEGGISTDLLPFSFFLAVFAWLLAYSASWFVFRSQNVWVAIVPAGFAALSNLSYLPPNYFSFFFLYLFAAMMLMMRLHFVKQSWRWDRLKVRYPQLLSLFFLNDAFWFSGAVILIASQVPLATPVLDPLRDLWTTTRRPLARVETDFGRLFSTLPSRKPVPLHTYGRTLPFRGAITLGENIVLLVHADEPAYWKAKVYDTYTSQGWVSSDTLQRRIDPDTNPSLPLESYQARKSITQKVEPILGSEVTFAAGQVESLGFAATVDVQAPSEFQLSLRDAGKDALLPADLQAAMQALRERLLREPPLTWGELILYLPTSVELAGKVAAAGDQSRPVDKSGIVTVRRKAPGTVDVVAMQSAQRLSQGAIYEVTSSISTATAAQLRAAGTSYPRWVQDRYLALPATITQRVRVLSQELTKDAKTPYDKVLAIEHYLRTFTYDLTIVPPPYDGDGVDHFLFTLKKGYSDYFASAMAVMIRSVGVPSRVATGYSTGDWDPEKRAYVVREKDSHAWPEVYFPGYGWVEFEPTTSLPSFLRDVESVGELQAGLEPPLNAPEEPFLEEDLFFDDDLLNFLPSRTPKTLWQTTVFPAVGYTFSGVLLALIAMLVTLYWGLWGMPPAARAYELVCRLGSASGLGPKPFQTPSEYGSALTAALPTHKTYINRVIESYAKARYSGRPLGPEEQRELNQTTPVLLQRLVQRAIFRR